MLFLFIKFNGIIHSNIVPALIGAVTSRNSGELTRLVRSN